MKIKRFAFWHRSGRTRSKRKKMDNKESLKIFVVDDDQFSLHLYEQHLNNLGYTDVYCFPDGSSCLGEIIEQPDVIFLDHSMDVLDGMEVLKKIKRFNPDIYVVFISGQENIVTAVDALKFGAFDYIVKGSHDLQRIEAVLIKIGEVKEMLQKVNRGFIKKIFSFV